MPKKLPGGFILEDDDAAPGAPAAVAPAPSAASAPPPGGFVLEDEPQVPPYTVTQGEWQGPPLPPDMPLNVAGRGAYGAVTGAASGILGMPGNLLQGMPWGHSWERTPEELPPGVHGPPALGPPKYVPHYVNPLPTSAQVQKGIDWVMEKTGAYTPPVPGTGEATAERMGKTFGEVVAPSKAIPGFSVGKLQDIWVGIQALVGEEATRMLSEGATPEDLERNGKIGAGVAPMLWALGYGLVSRGFQRSGRIHLPKQVELPAAQKKVGEATTGLETTTEDFATRLADLQEKNRVQQATAETQIVPLTAAQEAEAARVKALQEQTAQTTAQAEERAAFATRTAEEQANIAKSEIQTPAQLEAEALKPLVPEVEAIGPTPGVREPGAEIQQAVVRQAEADTAARQAGHTALADKWKNEIGPQLEDAALIDLTQQDVRPAFLKQRKVAGKAFDDVELDLKGQKVVEAPGMRKALGQLITEAEATNGSVAQQYLDWAELGLSKAQKASLKGSDLARAKQALKMVPAEKLEFSAVRDIEETLYAAGGGKPLGTLTQAPPRYLKRALQEDLKTFFNSDEGTMVGPAMQLAKAGWNKFLTEYDRGIMTQLTDPRAGYQAQNFLKFLKNTSRQQIPELEAVLRNVSPETQAAISAHVAADMVTNATDQVTKVISPIAMKRQVQRLQKNGTFGIFFDETQQKQILDAVHEMTGKDTSILPKFRKALEGRDPEDVARFIFEPGKVTRTEQFQTIAPDKFPLARQAWARQFLQDYETGGGAVVQKQLTQLLREDNGVSQLSIMFPEHEFPGVVDKFKSVHAELRSAPERAAATSERSTRMAEGARETKRIGEEGAQLTKEAGERLVAPAKARFDEITKQLTDAEDAFKAMKKAGTREEGQLKIEQARDIRRLSTEKKAAEKALHEVEEKVAQVKPGVARRLSRYVIGSGGTGLFAFLYGMTHTTPWAPYLLASGVIAGGITAAEASSFAMSRFARTPMGQRYMRDGLKQQYGAGAARWVNDVFLKSSAQPEGEPTNAPAP